MNRKGQITLEACVLIIICVVAWLAMQGYLNRAIQGNWRSNADNFSDEQFELGESREIFPNERDGEPAIVFKGSRITALRRQDEQPLDNFNVASASLDPKILRIDNWGVYESKKDDDED